MRTMYLNRERRCRARALSLATALLLRVRYTARARALHDTSIHMIHAHAPPCRMTATCRLQCSARGPGRHSTVRIALMIGLLK